MKRIIKGLSLFIVIVLSLVFAYPSSIYALTEQTSYVSINDTQSLKVGSLSFSNISFKDYSSTSTLSFGLTGLLRNSSNDELNYTSTAYYYDSDFNLVAQGYNSGTAVSGTSNFNQMSNLSILGSHNINEISYYRLSIETIDNANSSLTNTISLTPSKNYQYSSYDYVIDKYDVNIVINENNTFDITETITAYFNVSKHGIYRTIPLNNTITRLDGTTSTNRAQVTNVDVDNEYTASTTNGIYKLQIGSASRTLTGEQTYVIKYTYNLGKDPVKDYDELYYNIIGNEWDTVIGNVTFTITMPKEFDSSKLGFSSGEKGSTDNSKITYNVSGNKITGSYNGILGVREALTIRCELPEGYFVDATSGTSTISSNMPSKDYQYSSYDYVIDKYDVNIVVNENNTFDITETITAYFNVSKHGIYRTIPLNNTITRLDGTTSTNRAQVTNVDVDNEYTASTANGIYKLQIGSASRTLTGEQTYVIKYTYNLGKDPVKDYDELYYNIIGNEWDTVIGNVTFSITMPKEFDSSKLGFSSGEKGSTDNSKVKYNVDGNKITGSYNGILGVREALTIRCELPEGYFGTSTNLNLAYSFFVLTVSLLFIGIVTRLWLKYGKDNPVVETVEFYPPEGYNSAEIGFLYKGGFDNKSVVSLLIYLANKGYLKIEETLEQEGYTKTKDYIITKVKDYDGNNEYEKLFFKGLFSKNKVSVKMSDLYNKFFKTINKIEIEIENKYQNKIYEKNKKEGIYYFFTFIILFIVALKIISEYFKVADTRILLLIPALVLADAYVSLMISVMGYGAPIFASIIIIVLFGIPPCIFTIFLFTQERIAFERLIDLNIAVISIAIIQFFGRIRLKRTSYGTEILGKIKGFKRFLETAEKEQLENLVEQNPEYFYDILPYTYALGVSKKWINQFETIALQAASWYDSPNAFDVSTFGIFVNSTMISAQSAMLSSPSSDGSSGESSGGGSSGESSGGGSSGGGSSGGASGGGGGGSW